jgi:hypothetical protein
MWTIGRSPGAWRGQISPRSFVARLDGAVFPRGGLRTFLLRLTARHKTTVSAEDFEDGGFIELAKRLEVPIQGDFTAQVAEARSSQ